MDLSELGEFALIDEITTGFTPRVPSTVKGIGDDAALIAYQKGRHQVVSTDLMLEGIHFDLMYFPLKYVGFKAVSVNVSDLIAMGARPEQILFSVGVSSRFQLEDLQALYQGVHEACEVYGVDLVGGDTSPSCNGLLISVTAIGSVEEGKEIFRRGAKENDLICVSGNLGAAYMGVQLCEREKLAYDGSSTFAPKFEGREYLLQRFMRPYARIDVLEELQKSGLELTSMIDVSDGLASELLHLSKASGLGCRVYEEKIPIDYEAVAMAEEFNMNVLTAAMNGGEDYELLFTVPLGMKDLVEKISDVKIIGYMTAMDTPSLLISRDGAEIPLLAQGHQDSSKGKEKPIK